MVALFIFFALLGWFVLTAGARRALPIAASAAATWVAWRCETGWIASVAIGLAILSISAALSDWVAAHQRWRPTWITVEVTSAGCFGLVSGYAVFGSSGVVGTPLASVMIALAVVGAASAFRFRALR